MALKTLDDLVNVVISAVEEDVTITKKAAKMILQSVFATIKADADADDTVRIHNFGTFVNKTRAARTGRNPATGEAIQIAESTALHFKASKHGK